MPTHYVIRPVYNASIEVPLLWSLLGLSLHGVMISLGFAAEIAQAMAAAG